MPPPVAAVVVEGRGREAVGPQEEIMAVSVAAEDLTGEEVVAEVDGMVVEVDEVEDLLPPVRRGASTRRAKPNPRQHSSLRSRTS